MAYYAIETLPFRNDAKGVNGNATTATLLSFKIQNFEKRFDQQSKCLTMYVINSRGAYLYMRKKL